MRPTAAAVHDFALYSAPTLWLILTEHAEYRPTTTVQSRIDGGEGRVVHGKMSNIAASPPGYVGPVGP